MDAYTLVIGGGMLFFALTCLAILDIAFKDFSSIQVKAMWGFLTMIPFLGPIIYFLFGYRKGARKP